MAYEQKPGTGSLWVNDRKTEDKHPDRTGTLVLPDGTECFIDGWLKKTKDGKQFLSISIKPKNRQSAPASNNRETQPSRPPQAASKPRPPGAPRPPRDPDYGDSDAPDIDPNF